MRFRNRTDDARTLAFVPGLIEAGDAESNQFDLTPEQAEQIALQCPPPDADDAALEAAGAWEPVDAEAMQLVADAYAALDPADPELPADSATKKVWAQFNVDQELGVDDKLGADEFKSAVAAAFADKQKG